MHEFVRKFKSYFGQIPVRMNCCLSMKQCVDDVASTKMVLPDGTEIWIRYPQTADDDACGEAYLSDYDVWSPELPAEELADWVDTNLECCRRIDAYYEKQKTLMHKLNSSIAPDIGVRIKNVWRSAQSAVDMPKGFRYTEFRTNNKEDWVTSTLVYYSERIHQQTWLIKSGLLLEPNPEKENTDDWAFQPNYRPFTEALHNVRPGYSIDMGTELYVEDFTGETPEQRDKQAAYWLVQILSNIVDEAIKNPPPRCYEVLLADNAANLKKSDLERMSDKGIYSLLSKNIITGEQVLKGRPDLWKKLLEKGYVSGEMVARRVPEQVFWLAKNRRITPDYALKVQPGLKDKLIKAGLYTETDLSGYSDAELIQGAEQGTLQPVEVYRANPKLLTTMVEKAIITPQEAYKLDASIVTWLLINHYIGRAEAKKVKADIERYVKQKHKDVDWESLDAGRTEYTHYEGGQVAAFVPGKITDSRISKALTKCIEEDPDTPSATVSVGRVQASISPAGYEDNKLITDGNWKDATVYVSLAKDYRFIEIDGKYDKRMKGSEVVAYINDAVAKYGDDTTNLDSAAGKQTPTQKRQKLISDMKVDMANQFKDFGNRTDYELEIPDAINNDKTWDLIDQVVREMNVSYSIQEKYDYPGGTCYYMYITKSDEDLDSSVKDAASKLKKGFKKFQKKAQATSDDIDDSLAQIYAKADAIRKVAGLNSAVDTTPHKRAPRKLDINSSVSAKARLAGDRTIDGTHFFCVEGKGIGDSMQNQQQLQSYLPGYEVTSSGYADRLYVNAPAEAKDIVGIAVQHFNRDNASDLNSCGGVTQVGDIAQTTTFPEKKSINSDLTEDNALLNDEIRELGNLALSGLTDIQESTATGPAWKVTIKYPGDLLSDYTTSLLIPALDKTEAQVKFNEKMDSDVTIISWDEEVNSIDAYKEKYPQSNIKVLEQRRSIS